MDEGDVEKKTEFSVAGKRGTNITGWCTVFIPPGYYWQKGAEVGCVCLLTFLLSATINGSVVYLALTWPEIIVLGMLSMIYPGVSRAC